MILFSVGCGETRSTLGEPNPKSSLQEVANSAGDSSANSIENILDKTFDDIIFDIEPDAYYEESMLTDAIRDLDGKRIRIRGYILPTARRTGLKQFVLVRDNQECCFGPGAALYDCILVEMIEGESATFSIRPVAVEGRFTLSTFEGPDGVPLAIYHLDGESVR